MKVAVITKSATTKSGARVPFELAIHLSKYCKITIFAKKDGAEKDLVKKLKNGKIELILYKNTFDLFTNLKKGRFDLISFHSTLRALIAARFTFLPVVRTFYGTQLDAYLERFLPIQKINIFHQAINKCVNTLLWLDQKFMLAITGYVIAISKAVQKELKNVYGTRSKVIYLGTNLKPPTTYHLPPTTTPTILSVSRITPYKGFHILIDVVKKIRAKGIAVNLVIAGSGGKKNYLKYLQKIKGKQDRIITEVDDKTLSRLYQKSTIYVSCDKYLFFGLPILEAATFAKPQVAMNYFAANELILHGKTGYVANSQKELEKYLYALLKDKDKRQKMGNAAKMYAQNFNWPEIAMEYFKIFQKYS